MSPWALGLAVLLHVLLGLALWWMWLERPPIADEPVEITFEQPKPPEPPPPPPEQAAKPPAPLPPVEGLRPPAPLISEKPTQVPPSGDRPKDPPAPPPPPEEESLPQPEPLPPSLQQAVPPPQQQPPPAPQEQALATPLPTKPQPPAPPLPQLRPPESRPSPLTTAPPRRPPAGAPSDNPSPSPFVNPADAYSRARVTDNYLWQVVRKLQGYRYEAPHVNANEGITVVRVVIARDGRLLSVEITRSSGYPEFDSGVLAGVRSGSPYAPLPPEIHGDRATFDLPLVSTRRR